MRRPRRGRRQKRVQKERRLRAPAEEARRVESGSSWHQLRPGGRGRGRGGAVRHGRRAEGEAHDVVVHGGEQQEARLVVAAQVVAEAHVVVVHAEVEAQGAAVAAEGPCCGGARVSARPPSWAQPGRRGAVSRGARATEGLREAAVGGAAVAAEGPSCSGARLDLSKKVQSAS